LKDKANRPVAAVTAHDCQKYYDHISGLSFAKSTLVVEMKTIIGLFNQARRIGLISINPAAAIALPKRIRQVKRDVFTPTQIELLLKQAEPEWKTAILLGYYMGMRLGDAVTLEWSAVDFAKEAVNYKAHKTDQDNWLPMHATLLDHLSKIAGDTTGPICPTLSVVPIGGRSGLSKQFLAIMRKAGIANDAVETGGMRMLSRLSFHALRVTFNSELHKQGTDQELRMKLTGHKSKSVNDTYTRTTQGMLREEIKKLPSLKV
jgi:integrase